MPDQTSRDVLWQTYNAKLAIGSGGISGKGYLEGTTIQSNRVPLAYADSIFVQIGEEFGFVGASVLLLLYFILIHRLVLIALECKDRAGPYLIVGIIAMLLYQIFVNIGPFIGLMPLTGITLPLSVQGDLTCAEYDQYGYRHEYQGSYGRERGYSGLCRTTGNYGYRPQVVQKETVPAGTVNPFIRYRKQNK